MITSGDLIRIVRKEHKLSQKDVVKNLGKKSHSAISIIEKNTRPHSFNNLLRVLVKGIGMKEDDARKIATVGMMLDLINDVEDREVVLGKFVELAML